jgi:hypothetical protein
MHRSGQKWLRVSIWVIGLIVFFAFLGLSPLLRSLTRRDRESAVPQQGFATVVQILPPHVEENSKPTPAQVWVRFEGQMLPASEVFGSEALKVGEPAEITYRIGKSGRIYIDRVEPLPPPQ